MLKAYGPISYIKRGLLKQRSILIGWPFLGIWSHICITLVFYKFLNMWNVSSWKIRASSNFGWVTHWVTHPPVFAIYSHSPFSCQHRNFNNHNHDRWFSRYCAIAARTCLLWAQGGAGQMLMPAACSGVYPIMLERLHKHCHFPYSSLTDSAHSPLSSLITLSLLPTFIHVPSSQMPSLTDGPSYSGTYTEQNVTPQPAPSARSLAQRWRWDRECAMAGRHIANSHAITPQPGPSARSLAQRQRRDQERNRQSGYCPTPGATLFLAARRPYEVPITRHDLGSMDVTCSHCGALHRLLEQRVIRLRIIFVEDGKSLCCQCTNCRIEFTAYNCFFKCSCDSVNKGDDFVEKGDFRLGHPFCCFKKRLRSSAVD